MLQVWTIISIYRWYSDALPVKNKTLWSSIAKLNYQRVDVIFLVDLTDFYVNPSCVFCSCSIDMSCTEDYPVLLPLSLSRRGPKVRWFIWWVFLTALTIWWFLHGNQCLYIYIYIHTVYDIYIYIYSISCSMVMNQKLNHKLRMWYLYLYNYRYSAIWSRVHITGPPVSILGWRKECRTSDLDDDRWHFSSGFASWRDLNIQECDTNGKWYIYIDYIYNIYICIYYIYIDNGYYTTVIDNDIYIYIHLSVYIYI